MPWIFLFSLLQLVQTQSPPSQDVVINQSTDALLQCPVADCRNVQWSSVNRDDSVNLIGTGLNIYPDYQRYYALNTTAGQCTLIVKQVTVDTASTHINCLDTRTGKTAKSFVIHIIYSVSSVTLSSEGLNFVPGTIITCTADGIPPPTYSWVDSTTGLPYTSGQVLRVTKASTDQYHCEAYNALNTQPIKSVSITFNNNNNRNYQISSNSNNNNTSNNSNSSNPDDLSPSQQSAGWVTSVVVTASLIILLVIGLILACVCLSVCPLYIYRLIEQRGLTTADKPEDDSAVVRLQLYESNTWPGAEAVDKDYTRVQTKPRESIDYEDLSGYYEEINYARDADYEQTPGIRIPPGIDEGAPDPKYMTLII